MLGVRYGSCHQPQSTIPALGGSVAHRRLFAPSNMFVVPKAYGGFGELPEFIAAFRDAP